ncbi:ATP-binding protein [Sphingomonas naphthae]|uniref:histidine kinase n=1 Tax=Sphingomonas naphthae TaxID=1813468 RepID=A0ABY7TIN3_9SPHN|nr:GAF domain-containing protein [Sphingomonas naphthae]WCT73072.1 ATP-binding protein [Sphingomonas naphthae]
MTAGSIERRSAAWTESERLDCLIQAEILDTPSEPAFDDIVWLAKTACDTPIALVSLVDAQRQWFKAKFGVGVDETPIDTSVCALAIHHAGLFEIPDLAADPRTADFSLVTGAPHIRFYAGVPLVTSDGLPLGTLCVIDTAPRPEGLNAMQRTTLLALGAQMVAQIELRTLQRRRDTLAVASRSVGMWDWHVGEDLVVADPRFAALYGVDAERAARGAPIEAFFRHVHPEDRSDLMARVDKAVETLEPFFAEYRLVQPDGSFRWVAAEGRCTIADDGVSKHFPGVSFDITQRRSAEARQAALLRLSDILRDMDDPADIAFAASEILGQTLGVSRAGYGTIDPIAETITVERDWNAPGVTTIAGTLQFRDHGSYIEDLKRGETVLCTNADEDLRTRDQADVLKAITAHSFINMPLHENGAFVALIYINNGTPRVWLPEELLFMEELAARTRSATERRRAEHELAVLTQSLEQQVEERTASLMAAEEQLRQAQKMEAVGQLTGGLAHDFNNMLAGIVGSLEMMQVRIAQGRIGELEKYVTAAQSASRRAAALTHRLLAFSRRQTLDPKPTDINRLVADMEDLIRRTVGPAVQVEVVGAGGLWTTLVDPNQLENALLNLCINARDAMPEGGRITIETANKWLDPRASRERDLPEGQYLSLCVSDTGTGMTPETIKRAFDPFFTTKPLGEGTGLGLSMIYGFARQSGGQVRAYSEVGMGTTMCLYLPRHYGEAEMGSTAEPVSDLPKTGKRTVLVVDDEPTVRMLICELLEDMGHASLEAQDGPTAVTLLNSNTAIDLLITDVGLPGGLNGRQVADAAKVRRPDLKVIFITGFAENAVVGNGQLEPGMRLVTKPFAMNTLTAQVADLLAADR